MNYVEAYEELVFRRLLSDAHYAAATDEELADLVVQMAPRNISYPGYERRLLVERIAERRRTEAGNEPTTLGPDARYCHSRARLSPRPCASRPMSAASSGSPRIPARTDD